MTTQQVSVVYTLLSKWLSYLKKSHMATEREVGRVGNMPGKNALNTEVEEPEITLSLYEQVGILAGSVVVVGMMNNNE